MSFKENLDRIVFSIKGMESTLKSKQISDDFLPNFKTEKTMNTCRNQLKQKNF